MQRQSMMLPIIASTITIVFGLGGLIRGWQMGFKDRLDLITDGNNHPLPNPAVYAKAYARIYIGIGCVLLAMPLLLLLGMNLLIWCAVSVIIVWYRFFATERVADRARAKNK